MYGNPSKMTNPSKIGSINGKWIRLSLHIFALCGQAGLARPQKWLPNKSLRDANIIFLEVLCTKNMTINVHFPVLLEMPERELSNVIAMQKNMLFCVPGRLKKLCFCCCVWIVFAKFNFFLVSRRPFSYVFMNFTLLWGCVRSVLVFRSFCAVCGICIFHCLVGAWGQVFTVYHRHLKSPEN